MRYVILILAVAGLAYATGRQFNRTDARFDSLQSDMNLLNADVQRLDEAITHPYKAEKPVRRTEYFI